MATSTSTLRPASPTPRPNDLSQFSRKDLASLQTFLDRDFQNFWDVRQFGAHLGLRIKCPVCNAEAPVQREREDFVWYGYRKWRWLANHLVADHCRSAAISNRHRQAIKRGAAKMSETRFVGKKTRAA